MRRLKTALCAGLCAVTVLLTGCEGGLPWNRSPYERMERNEPSPSPTVSYEPLVQEIVTDDRFTLKYDATETLNPLETRATYNIAVCELMYEGLFTVTDDFRAEPVLCESMTTEDGRYWTIKIRSDVMMHDGKLLTAADVAYTINECRQNEKYISRLSEILEFSAIDDVTIRMVLDDPNYKAALLLDVPIIRQDTADQPVPPGTGPYTFARIIRGGRLTAFRQWRNYDSLPITTIYLSDTDYGQLTLAFTDSDIDLLQYDPTGLSLFNIRVDTEYHYYDTSVLQYLGFNHDHLLTSNYLFRQAIYYAVDREGIVSGVMNGAAVAAPVMFNREMSGYDRSWEPEESYSVARLCSILASLGFNDNNADGYLEYPVSGVMTSFTLDFIVNSENSYKVAAAEKIADTLRSIGINVSLRKLSWSDFKDALEAGEFDMYYGEVKLSPDFDFRVMTSRYGDVNYGRQLGVSDAALAQLDTDPGRLGDMEYLEALDVTFYSQIIRAYLGADLDGRPAASRALCQYFLDDCYVIPILYKRYAVLVHRDAVEGLRPTPSGVFQNITQWSINLD